MIMIAIGHKATGTVLNPWFQYPIMTTISMERGSQETAPTITPWSLMSFPEHGLELFAGPRELIFVPIEDQGRAMVEASLIQAYISYRTLIAYNLVGAAEIPDPRPEP